MQTKIFSHPGIPLVDHLSNVAEFGNQVVQDLLINSKYSSDIIRDLVFIAGVCHDIGKGTVYFQHYLNPPNEIIGPKNHSLISSILGMEIAKKYLADKNIPELDRNILACFVFTSVKRHHGKVIDLEDETVNTFKPKTVRELSDQIVNFVNDEEVQEILNTILSKIDLNFDWLEFKEYVLSESYKSDLSDFYLECFGLDEYDEFTTSEKFQFFYLHQLIYGSLLYSDKNDVIISEDKLPERSLNLNAITDYRERAEFNDPPPESLNAKKNDAYFGSLENLDSVFDEKNHLYSITLPTGLGKTITSLAVALKMKSLLKNQCAKIIITIPFTSIIDQNYDVFKDIFQNPDTSILLKHHHLASPKYKMEEDDVDEKYSAQQSKFLIESWQSEVVVTTFVQLLETLFTNDKGKLLKFPNLMNSIIILDEIQQIPFELWNLIRNVFNTLGEVFNCYFILMSATQPLIYNPETEIKEIVPNYKKYFSIFNRTRLVNKIQETILFDDFISVIYDYSEENPDKNILVILNTKDAARKCFESLVTLFGDDDSIEFYFLSTFITPFERKNIIDKIKKKSNNRKIIVSTQLIEAGVDISVHTVFRQFAPLDSIIQAAGRANRNNESTNIPSDIYIYEIEELKSVSRMIYGSILMQKTGKIFKEISTIDEINYLQIIERYFKLINEQSVVIDAPIIENICKLEFGKVGAFKFIEEIETESIYIQLNKRAVEVWEEYVAICEDENLNKFKKKERFAQIKAEFYDYVINVPIKTYEETSIKFDGTKTEYHFYLSELEKPSKCYKYSEGNYKENLGYVPEFYSTVSF